MNATQVRLADIELETKNDWDAGMPEAGRGYSPADAPLVARPRGVRLDNDGVYAWWLESGAVWTLAHDGVGWRAISEAWPSSREHVMRLADAAGPQGSYVGALPLVDGEFLLVEGVTYTLRLGASTDMSRTVIILSA